MRYYDTVNSKTVSEQEFIRSNPNTSFSRPLSDSTLAQYNLARMASDPRPDHDEDTQVVVEGSIEVRDGIAYQTYTVVDMSDEKKAVVAQRKIDVIKAEIASRRYDAEVEGLVTDEATGFKLDTSRETRAILTSVIEWLSEQTIGVAVPWKHADGSFEDLDVKALKALQTMIAYHVMGVFQKEKELLDAVANGTYTEDMLQEKFPVELPEDIMGIVE